MDPVDLGELRDDPEALVHAIDKAFDVHCHFTGEQKLLLVELSGHLLLKRLVEELSKNDDKRKDKEKRKDEERGSKKFLLLEDENKTLKHEVIYCTRRGNVKQLNSCQKSCISVRNVVKLPEIAVLTHASCG